MTWLEYVLLGAGPLVGFVVGVEITGRKWRKNADVPMRMEWKGHIYKVVHAEAGMDRRSARILDAVDAIVRQRAKGTP